MKSGGEKSGWHLEMNYIKFVYNHTKAEFMTVLRKYLITQ